MINFNVSIQIQLVIMKYLILFFATTLVLFSCGDTSRMEKESRYESIEASTNAVDFASAEGSAQESTYEDESDETVGGSGTSLSVTSHVANGSSSTSKNSVAVKSVRKMIWNANMQFQVEDVDASTKSIQKTISGFDGFVSKMDMTSSNYRISNTIEVRVGNGQFNNLIEELKKTAVFVDEIKIYSTDVTEEFIDIQSRLKTKKDVRERYIEVLRNKAVKVKDIIAAEEAIRFLTEEIEAKEGRLRYLKDKVSFSTITLTMYQKVDFKEEPEIYEEEPYSNKFTEALSSGWSIVTYFVLFLANIWPLLIVLLLFVWKGKWLFKKIKG